MSHAVEETDTREIIQRASHLYQQGQLAEAITEFSILTDLYKSGYSDSLFTKGLSMGGSACLDANRFVEALQFYTTGIEMAEKYDQTAYYESCTSNIGTVYAIFKDYERSSFYFEKAFLSASKSGNSLVASIALANLVNSLAKSGNAYQAQRYLKLQGNYPLQPEAVQQYHIYHNQGLIAAAEKNYQGDIYYQQKVLDLIATHQLGDLSKADILSEIGQAYMQMGNTDSATCYFKKMLQIVVNDDYLYQQDEAYQRLSEIFRKEGRRDSAAYYQSLHAELSDSIFNRQQFNMARDNLFNYENRVTTHRIATLGQQVRLQWWVIAIITLALITVGALLFVISIYYRRLRNANQLLVRKNQELILQDEESRRLRQQYVDAILAAEQPSPADAAQKENVSPYVMSEDTRTVLLKRIADAMDDIALISNSEFNLAMLAKHVGSNTKYVSQVINETYHKNFKTFLNEYRIREACKRLGDQEHFGKFTITTIAHDLGYNSPTSFILAFKKLNGMTPSVYQQLAFYNHQDDKE